MLARDDTMHGAGSARTWYMFSHICARCRILANRAYMIGLDKPCEHTVWRMVAILAYALEVEFSHEDALRHKGTMRQCINDLVKTHPRGIDPPRIIDYADTPEELDEVNAKFAYGTSLPQPVLIHTAVARRLGSARGGVGGSVVVVGRALLASTDSELRSITDGV